LSPTPKSEAISGCWCIHQRPKEIQVTIRVGINGFGRIGRNFYRALAAQQAQGSRKARTVSLPAFVADLLTPGKDLDALVFPDSGGGHMRGSNVRRRWWSRAVAKAQLFPRTVTDAAGEETTVYDFKLHELRHTAASLAIHAGANIKALQNLLGHESAGLTLDR
jgi:integrase